MIHFKRALVHLDGSPTQWPLIHRPLTTSLPEINFAEVKSSRTATFTYRCGEVCQRPVADVTRPNTSDDYFVEITCGQERSFFSLNSTVSHEAAAQSRKVHQAALKQGWELICRRFPRETVIAVCWNGDPLLCTYSTMVTEPSACKPVAKSACVKVALIETETVIRNAVTRGLNQADGFCCVGAFEGIADILARRSSEVNMVLVNRNLADANLADELRRHFPKTFYFKYLLYRDSDELFGRIHGAKRGYFLQRLPLNELLAPLCFRSSRESLSKDVAYFRIQKYFTALINAAADSTFTRGRLSPCEDEVFTLLSRGLTAKEVAKQLGKSVHTVVNQRTSIYRKLGVKNRTDAFALLHK